MRLLVLSALLVSLMACRTTDDGNNQPKQQLVEGAPSVNGKTLLLKRVVGGLTQEFPENRYSECQVFREDVKTSEDILKDLIALKNQKMVEGFIFRPQIPSVQIYGYIDREAILIQEIGSEKAQYRMPGDPNSPGNPRLSLVLNTVKEFCGDAQ